VQFLGKERVQSPSHFWQKIPLIVFRPAFFFSLMSWKTPVFKFILLTKNLFTLSDIRHAVRCFFLCYQEWYRISWGILRKLCETLLELDLNLAVLGRYLPHGLLPQNITKCRLHVMIPENPVLEESGGFSQQ
jgi:hypothetical protein